MSLLVFRPCARKALHSGITVLALLLIRPSIFGRNHSGLPGPARSGLSAGSFDVQVSGPRTASPATVTLQELQHIVPSKAWKEMEKAEAARLRNRTDDAIRHYGQAISLDPEFVAARNNLAVVYLIIRRPDAAVAQLEAAIKADPNRSVLFTNLALGYILIHRDDAAERAAREAADLDRIDSLPRLLVGLALTAQRKSPVEALQYFEEASRTYTEAHLHAARILMTEGQLKRAKSEIQTYLSSAEDKHNRAVASHWLDLIDQNEQKGVTSLELPPTRD